MAWVVDSCLLIDIAEGDARFEANSTRLLEEKRGEGLRICPMTFVELAPVFEGDEEAIEEFLFNLEIHWPEEWRLDDTLKAYAAWNRYVAQKKAGASSKRPLADILIGAFAEKHDGLLTRNAADFLKDFPLLKIVEP
jgi:predicted nucleic acid-binding protein